MSNSAQNLQLCPPYIVLEDCKVLQPNSTSSWRNEIAKVGMCTVEKHRILGQQFSKKFKAQYLLNHTEFREECQRQFCRAHSGLSESYMVHIFWSWSWSWKQMLKLKFKGAGQGAGNDNFKFNFELQLQLQSLTWYDMILLLLMCSLKMPLTIFSEFCMVLEIRNLKACLARPWPPGLPHGPP